ncbi:CC0125/CC1285 family lipoprotein [Asticcacaulis sp.]|uniref:CC0125/CC1285 family lipoprotein n=1 Tax=Asticcacaulis sp. TaxID=1872648 RepID=UPI00391AD10E
MRKMMIGAALGVSLVTLAACATPTPYQPVTGDPASSLARGYSDQRIEANRYRLKFSGNSSTSRETVEDYMLYRAAELALENGYDWFSLVGRNTKEDRTTTTTYRDPFPRLYGGFYYRYYRGGWGSWGAWEEDQTTFYRYETSAEVIFGKGEKPNDPNAYDAREVKQNLDPRIVRPTTDRR